jgi:DMSO/TMAO reductase YedYZ molybdopterin-dependent catalytic subunit
MANRSEKHPEIITRSGVPLNAEPPLELLRRSFITPTELFYVRNHGSIPELDTNEYRLAVTGMVQQELHLSVDEIHENFSKGTVTYLARV